MRTLILWTKSMSHILLHDQLLHVLDCTILPNNISVDWKGGVNDQLRMLLEPESLATLQCSSLMEEQDGGQLRRAYHSVSQFSASLLAKSTVDGASSIWCVLGIVRLCTGCMLICLCGKNFKYVASQAPKLRKYVLQARTAAQDSSWNVSGKYRNKNGEKSYLKKMQNLEWQTGGGEMTNWWRS